MKIYEYDPGRFPFHEHIARLIGSKDLAALEAGDQAVTSRDYSLYKNMEQVDAFNELYAGLDKGGGKGFYDLYRQFIREEVRPQYRESIYYQTRPSQRIYFRDLGGVPRFHRDSDYGHSAVEINYWVPLTPAFDTNTIWIESEVGAGDHRPVELKVGQYLRFDGASLSHGAVPNKTGRTRVSFDFRVIKASDFDEGLDFDPKSEDIGNPVRANAHKFSLCE